MSTTPTIILIKDTRLAGVDTTRDVQNVFEKCLKEAGIESHVQAVRAADMGVYERGVVVKLLPQNVFYGNVKDEDVSLIVNKTLKKGELVEHLALRNLPSQVRVVLRNCGVINPESMEEYIQEKGYEGLRKCLLHLTPAQVIDEMKKSGLRGRGGAGFPTWMKWNLARSSVAEQKYVICNGDEGDPGAYMDRSVLEGDPHSVIEGMIIAGYAIGASKGFFYIRAEYPLAVERIHLAIKQAYEGGFLGQNILGTKFSFDLDVRLGAGAFVCGEETALMASIEGKRGTPRPRPPFPTQAGLWEKPTIINNVETLANVPVIFQRGGDWFSAIGTEKSKGTKVFAITGKVKNSGLVEIPMGITMREIVYGIGGGAADGKKVLAVQTGGPSGGVIPESHFDTPVSYEHLQELGSIMGSGGMIVMDEDDCMIDIVKFYLGFCVEESCGKCAPCRIGGYQMLKLLEKISEGNGTDQDVASIKRIAKAMQKASLCALGQTAPNPVLSTLRYFEDEYKQHIGDKKCRAGKCGKLLQYRIMPDKCKKCRLCQLKCPSNAVVGDKEKGYEVVQAKCVKCGVCYEVCKFEAVERI
ncbi:MAG: NADH-ubiquinone oxidoreductase-F iron-sulfur binding region domain-containing protein [Verrucomicrobiae bacterium]|nr:NADH-ubiquinone oxidoreductase-F iron-sulfur binding region domain-containing protein [Verrucomicrobiae bacterium]